MVLRDQGSLDLDDPVARHVPEFPRPSVTIRQLLCHASGIQREAPLPRHVLPQGEALLAVLPEVEFPFRPFARWKFSNLGYCVLGEVVERASGQPFTEFVTARVTEPLGMDEVTFDPASLPRIRLARGYRRAPDRDCVARDPQAWEAAAAASGQLFGTVASNPWVRFAVGNDKSARSKYCGPTGKRSAGKLACSVWSGGKAVRPYLSLFEVILGSAFAAADAQAVGRRAIAYH